MNIHIKSLSGDFDLPVSSSETLLELKKKIEKVQGIHPNRQSLLFKGYLVNEDDAIVEEIMRVGGDSPTLVLPTASSSPPPAKFESDREITLINGKRHNFEPLRILPNREMKIRLKSRKFGVVYHVDGSEVGTRMYHIEVYEVKEEGSIKINGKDDRIRVVLIRDGDGGEDELDGVIKTYDEAKNHQETHLDKAVKVSSIVGNLGKFIGVVGGLIFGV